MKISKTKLPGVILIDGDSFSDQRGCLTIAYQQKLFEESQLPAQFVQDNFSHSKQNVLRGLHSQRPQEQGKLVYVIQDEIFDVAVDIRRDSPTFAKWVGVFLNDKQPQQLYIPPGFLHGFCVLSKTADVYYKCTNYYNSKMELGIKWNDPSLQIEWPIKNPILSEKDNSLPCLVNLSSDQLPAYSSNTR